MRGRIALEGLEFHAFHGVYPHERESGNYFEVDVVVETDFSEAAASDDIDKTVNYETIYAIVKEEMERPSKLLETVAEKIVTDLFEKFDSIVEAELKISKINPPIGGKCKKASVSISRKRS
jgi:dihydroneopterin aldolase